MGAFAFFGLDDSCVGPYFVGYEKIPTSHFNHSESFDPCLVAERLSDKNYDRNSLYFTRHGIGTRANGHRTAEDDLGGRRYFYHGLFGSRLLGCPSGTSRDAGWILDG